MHVGAEKRKRAGPKIFCISLHKSEGQKLGINTSSKDAVTLTINTLYDHGLFHAWNQEHRRHKVLAGDIIVEVNGVKKDARAMCNLCKSEKNLMILLDSQKSTSSLSGCFS